MDEAPERHPAIPPTARWRADLEKWETVPADNGGNHEANATGERLLHRQDGSLYQRSVVRDGRDDGPFAVFHPSGKVAREGRYVAGEIDGDLVARLDVEAGVDDYGNTGGEPLRGCCVPPRAVEMRAAYQRGEMQFERFYDDAGCLLLSDGRVSPTAPEAIADRARYDESDNRWVVAPAPDDPEQLHRYYRLDGSLEEEVRFREGCRVFFRSHADGLVSAEANLRPNGRREGAWFRRFAAGESPYLDARITTEEGTCADDLPVGLWSYRDTEGAIIKKVDFGQPPFVAVDDSVFANEAREGGQWMDEAGGALAAGQLARAFCAVARAAARTGDAGELIAFCATHVAALQSSAAQELARQASTREDVLPAVLSALLAGGDVAEGLRALSGLFRSTPRTGLDFAEAALLLAPDNPAVRFSRALVRIELGDDGGALADARLLEAQAPDVAGFLRSYVQVLFPAWEFWPAQERWGDPVEGVPDAPGQPLEAITGVMQVYATRLRLIREAVVTRAPRRARAPWLPPTLDGLLPKGSVPLRQFEATISDETDDGVETVEVEVDETLALEGLGVAGLMMLARRQWAALTWLAWAVGLDRVALPTEVVPPTTFTAGAATAITRYFRVSDTLQTGGLRARNAGAPSFRFAGADIDELPATIVEIAREETHELRALFLWLLSPENHSPFQSDLREV
jgi:hypothetical protein